MIRRFARPYARAILDVAGTPQKANDLRKELEVFEQARRSAADLQHMYKDPGIALDVKLAVTQKIAARLGLTPLTIKVLEVLIRNHRINDTAAIAAAVAAYVNQELGIVVADVRTAHQLDQAETAELQKTLQEKFNKGVELRVSVDPALLGGFVARVGSEIYDASVHGKIEKFRESLT
ncbi:MAG TPA: ATP synthase F1 subunit delta [Thermoanaerobaculia bacterium]|jgi:F-type H+-transporting ATPase subunit delta|nr:ATP synthase F1 subunit delta [Thermoanaerobaculia bacterium]